VAEKIISPGGWPGDFPVTGVGRVGFGYIGFTVIKYGRGAS